MPLRIEVPEREFFDERTLQFFSVKHQILTLEHSLVSISKWEEKWHKPYLSNAEKSFEETNDYLRCMTITQNVDPLVYMALTKQNVTDITAYIDDPHTASTIRDDPNESKGSGMFVTSEIIYYWMFKFGIPKECEKWHLNRLIMLIRVFSEMEKPKTKMSRSEIMARNKALNDARKAKYNSKG